MDDLVVSLCKFTTLLNPTTSAKEPVVAFSDDTKARMAAVTVFSIANKFGDFHSNWVAEHLGLHFASTQAWALTNFIIILVLEFPLPHPPTPCT